jgi:hypothetical protein
LLLVVAVAVQITAQHVQVVVAAQVDLGQVLGYLLLLAQPIRLLLVVGG